MKRTQTRVTAWFAAVGTAQAAAFSTLSAGIGLALMSTGFLSAPVQAHHSFAVFFDSAKDVTIKGTVTAFRFTNPHGVVVMNVKDANGKVTEWRAETNAPTVLTRRGWNRNSIKPGQELTIEGWPSRDGKPYIRLRKATDAQGNLVGTAAFNHGDQS